MSDPTPYVVSYSFAGYQALNPDQPLPAAEVDVEFNAISSTLDTVIGALAQVRRSDGNLQNGVVSWDGLSDDVKARFGDLGQVTVGDLNAGAFASQVEAETGVANDKLMTPLRAKQAVDSYRAFATQSQAQVATNNTTVVTPLRVREALDTLRAFASQAEAEAGTDNAKVLTALRTAQAIDARRPARTATATLTFGLIAAGSSITQTVALAGAVVNDGVILGLPAAGLPAGIIAQAWVSSADTVTIRLTNTTAGGITPTASQVYRVTAIRF